MHSKFHSQKCLSLRPCLGMGCCDGFNCCGGFNRCDGFNHHATALMPAATSAAMPINIAMLLCASQLHCLDMRPLTSHAL